MSGRSAYVRKKITETKPGEKGSGSGGVFRGRAKSSASSDNATISGISDYPSPPLPSLRQDRDRERDLRDRDRDITGVGTTNARFLKFSEPVRESEVMNYRNEITNYQNHSGGSHSGSSVDLRRDMAGTPHGNRPLEDFAYARARRPAIKTEDVSGIEKSGLRNILDKKSDEVRKGIMKTFNFKKKDRKGHDDKMMDFRPPSAATVRPIPSSMSYSNDSFNNYEIDPSYDQQYQGHNNRDSGHPWEDTGNIGSIGMMMSPPPTSTSLPPVPPGNTPPIKRWIGAGRPVQRWNKLRKDPELWDPNGDVLVFFGYKGQQPRPNPSFRLSSHIIEATESRHLITMLREGSTEEDILMPPSPIGAPPMLQRHAPYGQQQYLNPHGGGNGGYSRSGQPTPPISEDTSLGESDGQISYEMWFPSPGNMTKLDQLRHHITTRNVFALLYHASLVGLSLHQALSDLHTRLDAYMPPETDNVGTIINYLSARGIDDVRGDPETAVSILAWSEGNDVRWDEGWRESFLHCAGMYAQLETCADFKNVTPITRALLERACLETQLRVQAAEERLVGFQYGDMWPASVTATSNAAPAKAAADRLQKFLMQYYTREFGIWPPKAHERGLSSADSGDDDMWLTRTIAQVLQRDFAALYDYLVNRDVVWDGSEARSGRKWIMVSESSGIHHRRPFEADTADLPMTDMLIEFDNKLRFPHIPHPYPLVPESIPPDPNVFVSNGKKEGSGSGNGGGGGGGGLFKSGKKSNNNSNVAPSSAFSNGFNNNGRSGTGALERRIQLAYTESTNICMLGSDFAHSDLIDAFSKFEKADRVGEVDPSTARRGRWVLIYGILQTLASVSVDAPNVRYHIDVPYHLSPRLKGAKMPPWKTGGGPSNAAAGGANNPEEAAHELSHCWVAPRTWNGGNSAQNSGAEESSTEEGEDRSPITRGYNFPNPGSGGRMRPPAPPPSTAGKSSVTGYSGGYYTPAGMTSRSVRSNSSSGGRAPSVSGYTVAPSSSYMSSAGSVYSESEAGGSSVRSPISSGSRKQQQPRSSSARESARLMAVQHLQQQQGMMYHQQHQGGRYIDRVSEEHDAEDGYSYSASSSHGGGHNEEILQPYSYRPAPLNSPGTRNGGAGGNGGHLVLDNNNGSDQRSYSAASSGRDRAALSAVRGGGGRSLSRMRSGDFEGGEGGSNGSGSGSDKVAPVIRDFDELDVIDDHEP